MTLPIPLDYAPMEAKSVASLPEGDAWQYEPKWDGFRCLAFNDAANVHLRSKSGQPFERYFPEIVAAVADLPATRFVLDGELVIPEGDTLSFDQLLMRIHPAESRVRKLAHEHPARYVAFDLLVDASGRSLVDLPLAKRREALERFAERAFAKAPAFRLSPATRSRADVERWLATSGDGIDGIVAKRLDAAYRSGDRTGMQKYKRVRTADCVVGGFRSTERSGEWEPLRPSLVVEVRYDHVSGGRFRHGTAFVRWRPDKAPRQCTFEQIRTPAARLPEGTAS
jgi:ATP-dependent DNA ligase